MGTWTQKMVFKGHKLGKNPWQLSEKLITYSNPHYLNTMIGGTFLKEKGYITNFYSGIDTNSDLSDGNEFQFNLKDGE